MSRQHRASIRVAVTAALSAVVLAGCSSGNEDDVTQVAEQLHARLAEDDGLAACDLLADDVQEELAEAGGSSCAVAVAAAGIPDSGRVVDVHVYGTAAQVRYDDDVVFLAELDDGWRVTAAGCTPEADRPYDCTIQGG